MPMSSREFFLKDFLRFIYVVFFKYFFLILDKSWIFLKYIFETKPRRGVI